MLGNKVCSVGRITTVTAGVSLPLATVFETSSGVLRLRILSSKRMFQFRSGLAALIDTDTCGTNSILYAITTAVL